MPPEGVVHALRRIHAALVRGGELVDIHPVPPNATAWSGEQELGRFGEREFFSLVRRTERELARTVDEGLFEPEAERPFLWVERYDHANELLEAVEAWEGVTIAAALRRRILRAVPPLETREHAIVRS